MSDTLAGRVALVTGATSGVGLATARAFAASGALVVLTDETERPPALERAVFHQVDLRHAGAIADLFARIERQHGRLDILVNCAGVCPPTGALETQAVETLRDVLAVNVRATFACCRHAIALMRRNSGGCIINISSNLASAPLGGAAYSASMRAVTVMSQALAAALAPEGISVVALEPGAVDTPMRIVADAILTLARQCDRASPRIS